MTSVRIGYARASTDAQDLEVKRRMLAALGVAADRAGKEVRRQRGDQCPALSGNA